MRAILVVGTVVSSYLWSMLFFTSVAIVAGPMGTFGSLKFIPEWFEARTKRSSPKAGPKELKEETVEAE